MSPDVCPLQIDDEPVTEALLPHPQLKSFQEVTRKHLIARRLCQQLQGLLTLKTTLAQNPWTHNQWLNSRFLRGSKHPWNNAGQFVQQAGNVTSNPLISPTSLHATGTSYASIDETATNRAIANEITLSETTLPNFSIKRQEVLVLSSVLGRIPQAFVFWEEIDLHQPMSLTVVDDVVPTTMITTSSQEDLVASIDTDTALQEMEQSSTMVRGKRRTPKSSLTGSMSKRHPVPKFSATGPLYRDKSPYTWWCR